MKKAIGSLVVILLVIGLSSCDIIKSLDKKETDQLFDKAITGLNDNTLSTEYFDFSIKNYGTEKKIFYSEQGFEMSQIDEKSEKYYKDQYLYIYDIESNTKSKIRKDYKELLDEEFKENILSTIKSMLNETYIIGYEGEKLVGFTADKWVSVELDNQKLSEDNLIEEGSTATIKLYFTVGNFYSVGLYIDIEKSEMNYQCYEIGKTGPGGIHYIYMPEDLDTYENEIEKPVTVNGVSFSVDEI